MEEDHGHDVALKVAKNLVLYLRRPGGQSQFSTLLRAQSVELTNSLNDLNVWIRQNLDGELSVNKLAERANMSVISVRSLRLRHHRGAVHTIPFGEMTFLTNHSRDWV